MARRLQDATVQLFRKDGARGTGFFIAPGKIISCAHVVSSGGGAASEIIVKWNGAEETCQIRKTYPERWSDECFPDIALVEYTNEDHPCVWLYDSLHRADPLMVFGFTGDRVAGDTVTLVYEGEARYGEASGSTLAKLREGQITPGLSGAPVLNLKTGGVCGMMKRTRGDQTDLGGLAITIKTILSVFPWLHQEQSRFHQLDRSWVRDLPPASRSAASNTSAPFEAPRLPHPFVGRGAEQKRVDELLREHDVVIIKGKLGGLGKTTLASSIAHQLRDQYPDGVIWVRAAKQTFGEIASKLLGSLGSLSETSRQFDESSLEPAYRQMLRTRCALIVVDDLSSVDLLRILIPPATTSKFLITSRTLSGVGLAGVGEFELDLLPLQDAKTLLAQLCLGKPATDTSMITLVRELGALPLGICLAAGVIQASGISVQDYLSDFRQSRDLTMLSVDDGQSSVAKSFDINYRRLSTDAHRAVFRAIGIFEKMPIPLDAVAYCLGLNIAEARRLLLGIRACGLFESNLDVDQASSHPLLWRFSRELVAADDVVALNNKAAEWFAGKITFRDAKTGQFQHGHSFVEADLDRGEQAARHYLAAKNWDEAQAIIEGIADPLTRIGRHDAVFALMESLPRGGADSPWLRLYKDDFVLSKLVPGDVSFAEADLKSLSESYEAKVASAALIVLYRDKFRRHDLPGAWSALERSQDLKRQIQPPDLKGLAYVSNEFARLKLLEKGGIEEALALHRSALEAQRKVADKKGEAHTLRRIGSALLHRKNEAREALSYLQSAETAATEAGSLLILIHVLVEQAEAVRRLGSYQEAATLLLRARRLAARSSDPFTEAHVVRRLGALYEKLELFADARIVYIDTEFLLKGVGDEDAARYASAAVRMDKAISEAEVEIQNLEQRIAALGNEIDRVRTREGTVALRAKRKHAVRLRKRLRQRIGLEPSQIRMGRRLKIVYDSAHK